MTARELRDANLEVKSINFLFLFASTLFIDLHQFAVGLVLHKSMHVVVAGIIPHAAAAKLHRVRVWCLFEVAVRVTLDISAAANEPTYQADPQILARKTPQIRQQTIELHTPTYSSLMTAFQANLRQPVLSNSVPKKTRQYS